MTNLDKWYKAVTLALAGYADRHPDGYRFAVAPSGQAEVIRWDDGQTAIRIGFEWLKVDPTSQLASAIREGLQ